MLTLYIIKKSVHECEINIGQNKNEFGFSIR